MTEATLDSHTHNKSRNRKEKRRALNNKLDDAGSVSKAIYIARSIYANTGMASHEQIESAEDWINSSVNASKGAIDLALKMGDLKRSCSSQRLFIQLKKD